MLIRARTRAERLILIKAVINNLPNYYLGLFKIPNSVPKKIIQLQRNFFWAGNGSKRGIPLVAREVIQQPKHLGGLGVGDIIIKNAALLFKWWWWFLEGNNSLWKRVVYSNHYKQNSNRVVEINEGDKGGLWGQIMEISKVNNQALEVFSTGIWRKVGSGNSTLFWEHIWIGQTPLKEQFPRLYQISNQKENFIIDMGFFDGQHWCWSFSWRREFLQWEMELFEQLQTLSQQQHEPQPEENDNIAWRHHALG